ncbi:glutamine amidotransferase [Platysternon megacephalum]|uniref:Glutamine amidotransferase n=1 Tax=Platysternon megacephalum TaxID=55544 RepID=A0A4D9DIM8_9SAUR|nr:glutamine amidotransferase [Platysternon megacephalum]
MSHLSLSALSHRPSVTISAASQFSYSSVESTTSFLWSPSSFSLGEASVARSEPLCHTRKIVPVAGWEGSTHPIQAQPLPRPPVHSRRDRREQTTGLDQTSAHGSDFNIPQNHLQSQLGAPTLYTESLAKMIPNAPVLRPLDRDPRVKFNMSRVPFLSCEVQEELDCHVHTKRLQHEQGLFLTPQKPHTALLPPAPQTPIPGEPLLGEPDTNQQWEFNTDRPKGGFPAKVPKPLRSDTSPQRAQEIQEPCVCPSGSLPQKAHRIMASPDAILARLVPTAVVKLQDHVAQKCWEIQMEAFPKMVRESHRNAPLVRETALPGPLRPPREPGKHRTAAGNQTSPDRCTLPAGVDLTSPPPGTAGTEKTLAATLHIYRSELRKPLTSLSGTKGTEEKLELHMERKVISGEGSCLRPGAQAGESRADLPRTQCHQVAPEAAGSGQLTRSIRDSLIAGQAAHDLQIKHQMEMLSSSRPVAGHVSVCQLSHPGKMKGKKTQEETQVSAELHGLRDITAPHGFDRSANSKLSKDQLPIRVCKKCSKLRGKRPAGSAGADLPRRSHGIPQRWTPGDSSASSNHNTMPVVWLLPADRSKTRDGMRKTAPTKHPKMVSVATSTTGLLQAGEKATGSPDGSPPKPPKASSARTPSPARSKVPVLKQLLMCLKKTVSKLQNQHTIQELRCHGAGVAEPGRKILIIKGGFSIMNGHGQALENRDLKS